MCPKKFGMAPVSCGEASQKIETWRPQAARFQSAFAGEWLEKANPSEHRVLEALVSIRFRWRVVGEDCKCDGTANIRQVSIRFRWRVVGEVGINVPGVYPVLVSIRFRWRVVGEEVFYAT